MQIIVANDRLLLTYTSPTLSRRPLHEALRHTGYNLEDLKRQNIALGEENRTLQVQESTLRDPQRIDTIARTRLGMKPALPEQMTWPDGARTPRQNGRELLARNLSRFAADSRQAIERTR